MNQQRSDAIITDALASTSFTMGAIDGIFKKLWGEGATFVLLASNLTSAPLRCKAWVEKKGGSFLCFTVYDLVSSAVTIEQRPKTVIWLLENADGDFAYEALSESLRTNFASSAIYLLKFKENGEAKKIEKCTVASDDASSVMISTLAWTGESAIVLSES